MHAHKAISDQTCATHILNPVSTDCVPAALCTTANTHLIPDIITQAHTHLSKLALEGWRWKGMKGSHLEPREVGLLHTAAQIGRVKKKNRQGYHTQQDKHVGLLPIDNKEAGLLLYIADQGGRFH